ncbi:aldehyde dehydrogenase (NADP(+)) [Herbaspirillum seropedicae]|uniref:aldehyde dehydrogenase (NADP(+)) n=1 Tax=Herbaspirillum seropedicae TaxID=964 RepID=UPI000847E6E7|nr:aldehyde dehydrogenase (NADP(+)) [Herbaspirillum seropedicae]AON52471.1 NAD-dependent dehydrogenase [Herbaspirillum seropedicae]MDR6395834.1 NADP-dependent aldehyde dehydrogenase [Herbaspirillum seropedicae]QDD62825.1 aldehyde dehydrogenase (NADP(+)) [Herbaspirillum seropedicae]
MSFNILGHNYIGGQRSGQGDVALHSVDATTGALFETPFLTATDKEVAAAVHAAEQAYPLYRATTSEQRAQFLEAIADEIDALGDDFLAAVARETALPATPRLAGERARTSGQMRLFAKVVRRGDFYGARIDTALPQRQPLPRPDIRQYKIGVGPVAVFGASNFPLAFSVAGGDTAAALAAGCPVVFKAHSGHLVTSELVADAIERAVKKTGMPAGTFNMIYGDRVGAQLVKSAGIQAVGFTGSLRGGRALCDMAAARPQPIPVFAEMSSINPIILMPEALKLRGDAIAKDLAGSVTVGVGQLCTSPGLLLGVRSPELTAFIEKLSAAFGGTNPATMLNSGGLTHYNGGVARLTQLPGVKVIATGGTSYTQAVPHLFKADAALLFSKEAPLEEEVFGPSTVIVELESREQLLDFAAKMNGQLTATLQAEIGDLQGNQDLIAILEQKAGRLLLNGFPTGVEVCDAMVHGGPYPATSDARGTSVGSLAIERFLRPVCYQNYPDAMLPAALQNANPLGLMRLVDGEQTRATVG